MLPAGKRPFADARRRRKRKGRYRKGFDPNQPRGANGRWVGTGASRQDVRKFGRVGKRSTNQVLVTGKVGKEADEIFRRTGVRVDGYDRVIDSDNLAHTLRVHGNPMVERGRKPPQAAIRAVDFERVPAIVAHGSIVSGRPPSSKGTTARVTYHATVGRWHYTLVEEIRPNRKALALKTLHKRKREMGSP